MSADENLSPKNNETPEPPSGCPMHRSHQESAVNADTDNSECPATDLDPEAGLTGKAAAYKISRRGMLIGSGTIAALGLGLGGIGGFAAGNSYGIAKGKIEADVVSSKHKFRGAHQPGIITPQQQQMHMASYDVVTKHREDLIKLLRDWSLAAERMMAGELIGNYSTFRDVPPKDTGEVGDIGPANLTITFGFGKTLFIDDKGVDRFGIGKYLPPALAGGIPRMAAEKLDPQACNGDIVIQACSEDPMVALHAIHNLTRIAFGTGALRWSQLGYGRTASTSTAQKTPRNLFGFRDGTNNIRGEEPASELNKHLWIQPEDEGGSVFAGGSYLCVRKIKQFMEVWDELVLSEQETIIGRRKINGAPLSGGDEFTAIDFDKKDENGEPLIAPDSHVATVHPSHNNGARMLRRGYNFMEGNDRLGRLHGGLFFIAYVRDPRTHFIPILAKMRTDQMTEYLQHLSSGLFIIPAGVREGDDYVGQRLFA